MNIAVIFGGESCEHDISIITGIQFIKNCNKFLYNIIPIYIDKNGVWLTGSNFDNIDTFSSGLKKIKKVSFVPNDNILYIKRKKKWLPFEKIDMAFLCLHGQRCEDGSVASVLEMSKIPYSSSTLMPSSIAMDKVSFKYFLNGLDIPNVAGFEVLKHQYDKDREYVLKKVEDIGLPIIIKPSRLGSSIGINVCKNKNDILNLIEDSFKFDDRLLIEKYVDIKKEINIAVFIDKNELVFSNTEEPIYKSEILGFDEKYRNNHNGFDEIKRIMPAEISLDQCEKIKSFAGRVYTALGMFGVVRFDFILDKEDNLYLNEVNTIPGSMANYLFDKNLNYEKLIDRIIINSMVRKEKEDELIKNISSDVLSNGFVGIKK